MPKNSIACVEVKSDGVLYFEGAKAVPIGDIQNPLETGKSIVMVARTTEGEPVVVQVSNKSMETARASAHKWSARLLTPKALEDAKAADIQGGILINGSMRRE